MSNIKFTNRDISDYLDRLTGDQPKKLIDHCNKYNVCPVICAWYDDFDDFFCDWNTHVGLSESEAKRRLEEGKQEGEFCEFNNGEIVRLDT